MTSKSLYENLIALRSTDLQTRQSKLTALSRQLCLIKLYWTQSVDSSEIGENRAHKAGIMQGRLCDLFFSESARNHDPQLIDSILPVQIARKEVDAAILILEVTNKSL
jgi:hypothetical protein